MNKDYGVKSEFTMSWEKLLRQKNTKRLQGKSMTQRRIRRKSCSENLYGEAARTSAEAPARITSKIGGGQVE